MTKHLLFVDDEPFVLKALKRIFMEEISDGKLEIATADSGAAALEHLKSHPADLILTDYNMPGMTGAEFLEHAREIQPEALRMLITGRGDLEIVLAAINQGRVYKFFNKPWDDDDLRISLLRALEFKETQEQLKAQQAELSQRQAYMATMITVSHYINNFNCALTMSLESMLEAGGLTPDQQALSRTAWQASQKITAVLKILNRLEELKVIDMEFAGQMLDIEEEVAKVVKEIEGEGK